MLGDVVAPAGDRQRYTVTAVGDRTVTGVSSDGATHSWLREDVYIHPPTRERLLDLLPVVRGQEHVED